MSEPACRSKRVGGIAASTLLAAVIAGLFAVRAPELIRGHIERATGLSDLSPALRAANAPAPEAKLAAFATSGPSAPLPRTAARPKPAPLRFEPSAGIAKTVAVGDTAELAAAFHHMGYRLDGADDGGLAVPRVLVSTLPPDLSHLNGVDLRKTVFAQLLLPLVLQVNEMLVHQRHRLVALSDKLDAGERLSARERRWLDDVAAYYKVKSGDIDGLLERVDVIPPSLALAQAALESGWGTSRVAHEGNALFGQYMFDERAVPPSDDGQGNASFRLRTFGGLLDAVVAYAHNLNTHRAYRAFRAGRAEARELGRNLDGYTAAGLLTRYSTRGEDYIRDVRRLIDQNDLDAFDNAWLVGGKVTRVVFNDT